MSLNSSSIPASERIREIRKRRGMTQQQLASASGLGLNTVKEAESENGPQTREKTLDAIARGLHVTTDRLMTPGAPEAAPAAPGRWDGARDALHPRAAPDGPVTVPAVLAGLDGLRPDWEGARPARIRLLLPGLLGDAMSLDGDEGRAARSRALSMTAWLLTVTRQHDDAAVAGRMAMDAAPAVPDAMAVASVMTWGLLCQGRSAEAGAFAIRQAGQDEPRFSTATPPELAAYGKVLLMAANALVTSGEPDRAQDALSLARAAAARTGRDIPFSMAGPSRFGPVTVQVIMAETCALTGQPDKTLAIAEQVRGSLSAIEPAQRLRHRLDVASAHSMRREYGDAVEVMQELARKAPEWLGGQQYARDILSGVIRRRRTLTAGMHELADAVRLPL